MFTKTTIAFAAALILSAASAAMAGDSGENHQDDSRDYRSARSVAQINPWAGQSANAGAYGYAAAPIQKQRPVRTQNQSR